MHVWWVCGIEGKDSYLDETDISALLAEALTADVEAVLADKTSLVGADTAVQIGSLAKVPIFHINLCSIFNFAISHGISSCNPSPTHLRDI